MIQDPGGIGGGIGPIERWSPEVEVLIPQKPRPIVWQDSRKQEVKIDARDQRSYTTNVTNVRHEAGIGTFLLGVVVGVVLVLVLEK